MIALRAAVSAACKGAFMGRDEEPFWRRKSLGKMTDSEWESLCDGCGRCCLVKLEDADDSARTYFTDVGCRLLDGQSCRCRDYPNRTAKVSDCVRLTPRNINRIVWLPPTCAYRLLADGRDLYWWHPLVSGDPEIRAPGRDLGARARRGQRGRGRGQRSREPDRKLAHEASENGKETAGVRIRTLRRLRLERSIAASRLICCRRPRPAPRAMHSSHQGGRL